MKTSVLSVLGTFVVIGYAASMSLGGCAATTKSGFDDDAGTGDDGGVSGTKDGGKHDGSSSGNDSGTTGMDSGMTGGGDCTAFCMKESMVSGCPMQSACETTCNNSTAQVPAQCMSQWSAVLQCAATTGTIASCSSSGQAQITGCDSQISAFTTCAMGTTGNDGGTGSGTCPSIITCANACTTQACEQMCVAMGTTAAQSAFTALVDCLFGQNGTSGACGAMCGTQSQACTNCLNAAQMSGGACYTQVQNCQAN
jgi:hypothetical protein